MITDLSYRSQREHTTKSLSHLGSAALNYARQGKPVFPLVPGTKVPFKGSRGLLDATTDEDQIVELWDQNPTANIGIPTGEKSRILVLDEDPKNGGAESLIALEAEHGPLPKTATNKTGGDGRHRFYRCPANRVIRNSNGKLGPGLDIRGEGGYFVAPPSITEGPYEVLNDSPIAEAPDWLLERLDSTGPPSKGDSGANNKRSCKFSLSPVGKTIPEGQRDDTLTSIAGSLHDGSRTRAQLDEDLQEINKRRCSPPLPTAQVSRIARSIHSRPTCRPSHRVTPEVIEALDAIGADTRARECKGQGDHTDYDFMIAVERLARKYGGEIIPGGLRVTPSIRQIAEEASIGSTNTVSKSINRLKKKGSLRRDGTGFGPRSGALVLTIPPRAGENTKTISSPIEEERDMDDSVLPCAAPSAPRLRWSSPGHAGRLGKIRGRIVDTLESTPDLTLEELASRLNHKRPRDLRRRTLGPLLEAGVVVCVDGRYSLSPDWREALEMRREEDGEIEAAKRQEEDNRRAREAFRQSWDAGEVISKAERRRRERWRILHEDRLSSRTEIAPEPVPNPEPEPKVPSNLSSGDLEVVEAVLAWERVYGTFDFSWSAWKELFYTGPIPGVWPDKEVSDRVAAYLGRLSIAA